MDLVSKILSLTFMAQVVRISIPYILAATGGVFSERSGVINIALEGIMLNGAFSSILGTYLTGSPFVGLLSGVISGIATGFLHAIISIRFRADQIISGIAINLLAVGATKFFLKIFFDSSSNSARVEGLPILRFFPEGSIGSTINQTIGNPIIILTLIIVVLSHFTINKTVFGLRIRAVGEHPRAADTLGVRVNLTRYLCVILSGALAGLAGAWLALDQHQFTDGMSNGRGFIALAAVIFGKWNPLSATLCCLFFGFAETIQITLQSAGTEIPTQFIQMVPYILTMVALSGFIGHSKPPAAIGKAYEEN